MSSDPIETKLAAARTRLILDKPFLGALVLRLPLQAGQAYTAVGEIADGTLNGLPYVGTDTYEIKQFSSSFQPLREERAVVAAASFRWSGSALEQPTRTERPVRRRTRSMTSPWEGARRA